MRKARRGSATGVLELGKQLRALRGDRFGEKGSLALIARKLQAMGVEDVSRTTLWRYEQGRVPDAAVLMGLAQLYRVEPQWLFDFLAPTKSLRPTKEIAVVTTLPRERDYSIRGIDMAAGESPEFVRLPVLAGRIAAGEPLVLSGEPDSYLSFRADFARKFSAPVLLRVGKREESMLPEILPDDLVAMDQAESKRLKVQPDRMYVLNLDGGGTIKHVEAANGHLVITARNPDRARYRTRIESVRDEESILDLVKGEVVWIGRYVGSGREKR